MRPVVLRDDVDPESIASTPGIYAAEDTSPAFGVLEGLAVAGEARELGDVQTEDGHHMIAVEIGPKRNAAGAITIGAEFFAGAKADYSAWQDKWWREAIQNAVDAGATEVHCKIEYLDADHAPTEDRDARKFARVSCGDDGVGMTEDILLNKFLVLGRSGKGAEPGSVGGFGKAKELLLLPWVSWSVITQRTGERGVAVEGHGIQYDVQTISTPGRHGTLISVVMSIDDATTEAHAISFIKKCFLPRVAFVVNDKPYKANLKVGDLIRSIGTDANVYFDKRAKLDSSTMLVRVNGMYMHERWISSEIKGTVIVELLGRSTDTLTANRDSIGKSDLRYALDSFTNQLAADTKTALRKKQGILRERFEGAGKFKFKPEIVQRDILFAMGDMFPRDGDLSEHQKQALISVIGGMGGDEGKTIDLRPSRDSIAAMMEVSFRGAVQVKALAFQAAWQPDFFIYNEIEGFKVPSKFRPEKMTPALRKLARFWAELCRFVLIQLNSSGEYGVGWIFDRDTGAAHQYLDNEHWLLLNPFIRGEMGSTVGTGEMWSLTNPQHVNFLYALAVHEATHMASGITYHDEAFASAFTENVALTANRGRQIEKIRKSVVARAARPGEEPQASSRPASPPAPSPDEDINEGLRVYLDPAGEIPGIGPERPVYVDAHGSPITINNIERLDSDYGSTRYRYIGELGGSVGALQVVSRDGKIATMANLYVLPGWRRTGIARKLLEQAREDFDEVLPAKPESMSPAGAAWTAAMTKNPCPNPCPNPTGMIWVAPGASTDVVEDLEIARDAFLAGNEAAGEVVLNGLAPLRIARCIRRLYDTDAAIKHAMEVQQNLYKIYGEGIHGKKFFFGDDDDQGGPEYHLVVVSSSRLVRPDGESAIFEYDPNEPSKTAAFEMLIRNSGEVGVDQNRVLAGFGIQYVILCEPEKISRTKGLRPRTKNSSEDEEDTVELAKRRAALVLYYVEANNPVLRVRSPRIKISYEVISIEDGETEERGWEDEEGVEIYGEYGREGLVASAVKFLTNEGVTETSSTNFHPGTWYSSYGDTDYGSGTQTNRSFHLYDFTPAEEAEIFNDLVSGRMATVPVVGEIVEQTDSIEVALDILARIPQGGKILVGGVDGPRDTIAYTESGGDAMVFTFAGDRHLTKLMGDKAGDLWDRWAAARKVAKDRGFRSNPADEWRRGRAEATTKWTKGSAAGADEAGRDLRSVFGARAKSGTWGGEVLDAEQRTGLSVVADAIDERKDDLAKTTLKQLGIDVDEAVERWNLVTPYGQPPLTADFRRDFQDAYLATVMTFIEHVMPTRNPISDRESMSRDIEHVTPSSNPPRERKPCIAPHATITADPTLWDQCAYVGIHKGEGDDQDLELRNCTCGSTLAREVTKNPSERRLSKPDPKRWWRPVESRASQRAVDDWFNKRGSSTPFPRAGLELLKVFGDAVDEGADDDALRISRELRIPGLSATDAFNEELAEVSQAQSTMEGGGVNKVLLDQENDLIQNRVDFELAYWTDILLLADPSLWGEKGKEASELADRVRAALIAADEDVADALRRRPQSVWSSMSPAGKATKWTRPRWNVVVVVTESGIGDPYEYDHVHAAFERAVAQLAEETGRRWGWESVNAGVVEFVTEEKGKSLVFGSRNPPKGWKKSDAHLKEIATDAYLEGKLDYAKSIWDEMTEDGKRRHDPPPWPPGRSVDQTPDGLRKGDRIRYRYPPRFAHRTRYFPWKEGVIFDIGIDRFRSWKDEDEDVATGDFLERTTIVMVDDDGKIHPIVPPEQFDIEVISRSKNPPKGWRKSDVELKKIATDAYLAGDIESAKSIYAEMTEAGRRKWSVPWAVDEGGQVSSTETPEGDLRKGDHVRFRQHAAWWPWGGGGRGAVARAANRARMERPPSERHSAALKGDYGPSPRGKKYQWMTGVIHEIHTWPDSPEAEIVVVDEFGAIHQLHISEWEFEVTSRPEENPHQGSRGRGGDKFPNVPYRLGWDAGFSAVGSGHVYGWPRDREAVAPAIDALLSGNIDVGLVLVDMPPPRPREGAGSKPPPGWTWKNYDAAFTEGYVDFVLDRLERVAGMRENPPQWDDIHGWTKIGANDAKIDLKVRLVDSKYAPTARDKPWDNDQVAALGVAMDLLEEEAGNPEVEPGYVKRGPGKFHDGIQMLLDLELQGLGVHEPGNWRPLNDGEAELLNRRGHRVRPGQLVYDNHRERLSNPTRLDSVDGDAWLVGYWREVYRQITEGSMRNKNPAVEPNPMTDEQWWAGVLHRTKGKKNPKPSPESVRQSRSEGRWRGNWDQQVRAQKLREQVLADTGRDLFGDPDVSLPLLASDAMEDIDVAIDAYEGGDSKAMRRLLALEIPGLSPRAAFTEASKASKVTLEPDVFFISYWSGVLETQLENIGRFHDAQALVERTDKVIRVVGETDYYDPREPKENPAWVTKLLAKHFEFLEDEVPPKWLPKLTQTDSRHGRLVGAMEELGCGAYGCVLQTLDKKVVLKITTDDTEFEFAEKIAGDLTVQVTVHYHLVAGLPDMYKGRRTYLLWRDSADRVGEIDEVVEERGGSRDDAEDAVDVQHKAAQVAYAALMDGQPVDDLIERWKDAARSMGERVPELAELAEGLITNLEVDKVFLADIHAGNLGLVDGRWLVIDPGHVAVLEGK